MDQRVMSIREQGWLQTIQAAARSGQSTKEWCEQNGIAESTFYRWKQRLRGRALARLWPETAGVRQAEGQAAAAVPVFAQLSCRDGSEPEHIADIQTLSGHRTAPLRIRSGALTLELGAELSEEDLCKVMRAVRNAW